ncbi:Pr6Pr family membrane protein [Luteibacter sp. PPL201]|uniref:Pr6Pr family membrane protein n=1 Tax=Luteibacter sahnii TaxID=3021977 RepID=A0ABT6BBR2_9GAMM|nr:Pr6Pr family membrane protein [Luteibacter sp. PPL193]MDY1547497.1 Pr6Pr family membrane protein [Luteibacter sp. PPL193]
MVRRDAVSHLVAVVVAAVAWPGLLLQYWLILWSGPLLQVTVRYLSFFTILSNLLVALVATAIATGGNWAPFNRLRTARVRGLAALSITVTWLVYMTVLQGHWHPRGVHLIADRTVHYVVPLMYVAWWATLQEHGTLSWGDIGRWLGFPLAFAVWTLLRGAVVHEYPYPFMDVDRIGYGHVVLNSLAVGVLFVVLGALYVSLDRVLGRRYAQPT